MGVVKITVNKTHENVLILKSAEKKLTLKESRKQGNSLFKLLYNNLPDTTFRALAKKIHELLL